MPAIHGGIGCFSLQIAGEVTERIEQSLQLDTAKKLANKVLENIEVQRQRILRDNVPPESAEQVTQSTRDLGKLRNDCLVSASLPCTDCILLL